MKTRKEILKERNDIHFKIENMNQMKYELEGNKKDELIDDINKSKFKYNLLNAMLKKQKEDSKEVK